MRWAISTRNGPERRAAAPARPSGADLGVRPVLCPACAVAGHSIGPADDGQLRSPKRCSGPKPGGAGLQSRRHPGALAMRASSWWAFLGHGVQISKASATFIGLSGLQTVGGRRHGGIRSCDQPWMRPGAGRPGVPCLVVPRRPGPLPGRPLVPPRPGPQVAQHNVEREARPGRRTP